MLFARHWLYEHRLVIVHDRLLRKMIAASVQQFETELATSIQASIDHRLLERWSASLTGEHGAGTTVQTWLWAAPSKHSTRSIEEVIDRIKLLRSLDVHHHLTDVPVTKLRRYAKRLASRAPAAGARITEPRRTIEVACFLRYCLLAATDTLILMVRRRVADLWRDARRRAEEGATNWAATLCAVAGRSRTSRHRPANHRCPSAATPGRTGRPERATPATLEGADCA